MAYHLRPILALGMQLPPALQSVFFPLGVRLCSEKTNTLKRFSSSLNVMVGYLCVQSLPEWAYMLACGHMP